MRKIRKTMNPQHEDYKKTNEMKVVYTQERKKTNINIKMAFKKEEVHRSLVLKLPFDK